jgi:GT2 family glycosyltransferase
VDLRGLRADVAPALERQLFDNRDSKADRCDTQTQTVPLLDFHTNATEAKLSVTAVVVSHDSGAVLHDCLSALAAANIRTILVDNASRDSSTAIGESFGAFVIANGRNEGYGRAMNIGIRAVRTPFVLIINPDVTLDHGAIASLRAAAASYPNAAILAPRIVEPDGRIFFPNKSLLSPFLKNEKGVKWAPEGDCSTTFLQGCCWLVRRDVFLAIGGFDPEIFLFYEDDDLCRRIIEAGYSLVHVHGAIARHKRGASCAPQKGRLFKARFHLSWSRLYVARKWGLSENRSISIFIACIKWLGSVATFNLKRRERYAGTVMGYISFRLGGRALKIEGVE